MRSGSWFAGFAVLVVLSLANFRCWSQGVGTSLRLPGNPRGTELEMYFGWPACYRAELWRSDDPGLASRILSVAPFYSPRGEMERRVRRIGGAAIAVDVLFALLLAGLAAVAVECLGLGARHGWSRSAGLAPATGLVILWFACEGLGVPL